MPAPKKKVIAAFEAQHGLEEGDLTYQQRHQRMSAMEKGEDWFPNTTVTVKKRSSLDPLTKMKQDAKTHPLQGYKILIAPKMIPDAKRIMGYDEPLGPEIEVELAHAGEMINASAEDTERMVGDYKVTHVSKDRILYAKTTFPKIGTEMSITIGDPLPGVVVIEGNKGERGYLWSLKSQVVPVEDKQGKHITMVQLHGLKTMITHAFPHLLSEFSGKQGKVPMSAIDGVSLVAAIPQTLALLQQARREKLRDAQIYGH